jgi:multiple sugar transport system permease protein
VRLNKQSYVAPGLIWVAIFTFLPLLYLGYLSLMDYPVIRPAQFVGLENYTRLLSSPRGDIDTVVRTAVFALGSTTITMVVGILAAWVFSYDLPGIRALRALFTIPMFVAPIAVATIGALFLNPFFGPIRYDVSILANPDTALLGLIIADAWQWTPLVFVVVLNAINAVSKPEREAARLETKSAFDIFTLVTYPRVRSALTLVLILRLIQSISVFELPYNMTDGGPVRSTELLGLALFRSAFQNFNMGYAAALAVILLIPITILSAIFFSRMRKRFTKAKRQSLRDLLESLRYYEAAKN